MSLEAAEALWLKVGPLGVAMTIEYKDGSSKSQNVAAPLADAANELLRSIEQNEQSEEIAA